ncbi:hypothetical protein AB0K18_45385 [Nonomuraea sp. NPDC049421]
MPNDQPDIQPDAEPDAEPDIEPDADSAAVSDEGLLSEPAPDGAHEPL